ncbi:MAG: BolA/IbaG family iron-sulfur metabolism protein [Phycisphaerales bacterium]|nr:BolA/IbaG family iron-sulfur metabolism protein [Phycisphaerales bacterium]MCC7410213.1 BolA/IbaG family iron-sulfur metabolism protein [Gammaproteobacteria bacterium]
MTAEQIERLIAEGIPGATVRVQGDDGRHFQALVVADAFTGLSQVKQHQLVYGALGHLMQEAIHALSLRTLTPTEWESVRSH